MTMKSYAERVKNMREKVGWSQRQLADHFGVPPHTVQSWEQGYRTPPEYVVTMMERLLKMEGLT